MSADATDMIEKHIGYVVWSAEVYKRYFPTIDFDDLVQEGRLGLKEAADKYQMSLGEKFISFARWHVKGRMSKFCKNQCQTVRVPVTNFHRLDYTGWDEPIMEGGTLTLADTMAVPESEPSLHSDKLESVLRRLTAKEQEVIRLIFWEGRSMEEIAQLGGKRRQAVYNLRESAMEKLRQFGAFLREAA
jgi:RNA polymerase sigma factor (sigma-70 family)